jgi:D-lyxose ketol-isomerase
VLIGEVSNVNDDETDNWFREPIGRFAAIDEDEAPMHLLVSDYATGLCGGRKTRVFRTGNL